MGFWSALTGGDSGSTTEQTQKQNQSQTQKATGTQTGKASVSTLDAGTVSLLQDVIKNLGTGFAKGSGDAENIRSLLPLLLSNTSPEAVQSGIDAASAAATRTFRAGEGSNIKQLEQQVGSRGNSFSQLIEQQGNVDLATVIAQVTATQQAQARQQRGQDVATAVGADVSAAQAGTLPLTQLLQSIEGLKGSTTTQQTEQQTSQDMLATLLSDTTSKGHTSSSTANGFIPTFTSLFGGK